MTTKAAFCTREDSGALLARPCPVCDDHTYCCTECGVCLKCAERSHDEGNTCLACSPRLIAELKEELKYAGEMMESARSCLFVVPALEKCLTLLRKGKKPLEPDISSWESRLSCVKSRPGATYTRLKVRPFIEEGVRPVMDRDGQISLSVNDREFLEVGTDLLEASRLSAVCNKLLMAIARRVGFETDTLINHITADENMENDLL